MRLKLLLDLELDTPFSTYSPEYVDLWIHAFAEWIKDTSDEYSLPELEETEVLITDVDIEMLD
jgi:hypothetical protein